MAEGESVRRRQSFWGAQWRQAWESVPARIRRPLAARFQRVSKSEGCGYLVWAAMGVVVGVPEIWAAISGDGFYWPTISGTVGHLEDKWSVVAVVPVAVLAASAYALGRFKVGDVVVRTDDQATVRTQQGRLAKLGPATEALVTDENAWKEGRREWSAFGYFTQATIVVIAGSLIAAQSNDRWVVGYVLYSLIAVEWILIPNAAAYWRKRDAPFTTLFYTVRLLEDRLHAVAFLFLGGIAVLLIHLAVYPWPDLARDSASYAGLTPSKAEKKATDALSKKYPGTPLKVSAQSKEVFDGSKAWFVYFRGPRGYSNCVVVVSSKGPDHVPSECRT